MKNEKNKRSNEKKKKVCFQSETKKAVQVTPRVFTESKEQVTAAQIVEWRTEKIFFLFFSVCVYLVSWPKRGAGGCKPVDMQAGCLLCFLAERKEGRKRPESQFMRISSTQRLKRNSGASPSAQVMIRDDAYNMFVMRLISKTWSDHHQECVFIQLDKKSIWQPPIKDERSLMLTIDVLLLWQTKCGKKLYKKSHYMICK